MQRSSFDPVNVGLEHHQKNMNYIVISELEDFMEGAKLIKEEAARQNKLCTIMKIKEVSEFLIKNTLGSVYFLTNDSSIPTLVKLLKQQVPNMSIINEEALCKNVQKLSIQNIIRNCKIEIPKNSEFGGINKSYPLNFPLYLKSQFQADRVKRLGSSWDLKALTISPEDYQNYYLEEAIEGQVMVLTKVYYVKGKIFCFEESILKENIPASFVKIMKEIEGALKLPVFSADIFIDWPKKRYVCIDINPASAFFGCAEARKEFVEKVLIS